MTDGPIFVVGAGRSGTALLQALLGSHPRIAAPPEVHYFLRISELRDYWGDLADDAVLRRVVEATIGAPALAPCGFDADRIVARVAAGPRTYAAVLDTVMRDFAEREGKARWSEKSPLQPVDMIWAEFPDAQCVHIVRDPRDAIPSNLAKTTVWDNATVAAYQWRGFTRRNVEAGDRRAPEHYLRIRYEDLAADPEAVMAEVFGFLGEGFDPAMISDPEARRATIRSTNPRNARVLQPIDTASLGTSRELASPREQLRIAAVVDRTLETFGYPRPSRREVRAGRLLNLAHLPRVYRAWFAVKVAPRLRTPQGRYAALQRRHREGVARLDAKMARLRARERARDGSAGHGS